jgi:acyl carrier protein
MLEFLGRLDHQVKVRGYRIELGEIEAALGQHAEVSESVVMARGEGSDKRLVAYVVSRGGELEPGALRGYLRERLPEYMLPSAFVFLPSLPLTPNGKVDFARLPLPDAPVHPRSLQVEPRDAFEARLAGIWSEFLETDRIGIHDNFFEWGGHSLLATQVISRIRQVFEVELPLRALFEAPTVAELAERIRGATDIAGDRGANLERMVDLLESLSDEEADTELEMLENADEAAMRSGEEA